MRLRTAAALLTPVIGAVLYVGGAASLFAQTPEPDDVTRNTAREVSPPERPDEVAPPGDVNPEDYFLVPDDPRIAAAVEIFEESWLWEELGSPAFDVTRAQASAPTVIFVSLRSPAPISFTAELPYLHTLDSDPPPAVRPVCTLSDNEGGFETRTTPKVVRNLRVMEITVDTTTRCVLTASIPPALPAGAGDERETNPPALIVERPPGYVAERVESND